MDRNVINELVGDWDDVYKKGQLSLWVLLSISEHERYAQEITDYMYHASNGAFEVKEQSLYRALRRFKTMGLVQIHERESPSSGPKRKYYSLTPSGEVVLGRFVALHILPLLNDPVKTLLIHSTRKVENEEIY